MKLFVCGRSYRITTYGCHVMLMRPFPFPPTELRGHPRQEISIRESCYQATLTLSARVALGRQMLDAGGLIRFEESGT